MDTNSLIKRLEELEEVLTGHPNPSLIHVVNGLLEVVSELCWKLKDEDADHSELELSSEIDELIYA